jgi:hypothetical protein
MAPIFFGVAQKTFEELFFRALLETHLVEALNQPPTTLFR